MLRSHIRLPLSLLVLVFLAMTTGGVAPENHGPGGTSRVLHVDCGFYSPGNPPWTPDHDEVGFADRRRPWRGR